MAGIMGPGKDIDLAFGDFVKSWNDLNGFDGLKRIKNSYK
jgi:hypothetical protein